MAVKRTKKEPTVEMQKEKKKVGVGVTLWQIKINGRKNSPRGLPWMKKGLETFLHYSKHISTVAIQVGLEPVTGAASKKLFLVLR